LFSALGRCDESARAELAAIERLPPGGRAQLDALKRCLAGGLFGGSPFTAAEERLVHEHVLAAEKKAASNGGKWGGATSTGFINK
jgi:hypothetical protein